MMRIRWNASGSTITAIILLFVCAFLLAGTTPPQTSPGRSDPSGTTPRPTESELTQAETDKRLAGFDKALLDGDRPVIHVVSPPGSAATSGTGSDSRILVVIEIIDVTGSGIDVNDSGLPRFVDPNHNVDVFSSYVVRHQTYVNHLGQAVLQVVSEIPVDSLRGGEMLMSPPIDYRHLTSLQRKEGFAIPNSAMLDAASFVFRVKDKQGVESDQSSASGRLVLGFSSGLYTPPPPPPADSTPGVQREEGP